MAGVVWVSGASSEIGAAFVDATPDDVRIIGVSRRPHRETEDIPADLGDPASWSAVEETFERGLAGPVGSVVAAGLGSEATLMMCSSPAAHKELPG